MTITPLLALCAVVLCAVDAQAAVRTEPIQYQDGDTVLEGMLAYDDVASAPRPGVLVVHEWRGLEAYTKWRAEELARLGYVAFAVDMYGKGVLAKDHTEAAALSGIYRNDRGLMRGRILAALETLQKNPFVDRGRIAAIGYCFGGTTVLELARSGADVLGVASFHGALDTPTPEDAKQIKGKVLVLQGGSDPYTRDQVPAFEREMKQAGVDYTLVIYEGAVHSFTVLEAGNDKSTGAAYDPEADKRSWEALREFLKALFGPHISHIG